MFNYYRPLFGGMYTTQHTTREGHRCGRYASYWNAYFFNKIL